MVLGEQVQINGAGQLFRQEVSVKPNAPSHIRDAAVVAPASLVRKYPDSWSSSIIASPSRASSSLLAIMSGERSSESSQTSLLAEAGAGLGHWFWSDPANIFSLAFVSTVVLGFFLFWCYKRCHGDKSHGIGGGGCGKGGYESFGEGCGKGFNDGFGKGQANMGMGPPMGMGPAMSMGPPGGGKGKPAGNGKKGPEAGAEAFGGMEAGGAMAPGGMAAAKSLGAGKGKAKGKQGKMQQPAAEAGGVAAPPPPAAPPAAVAPPPPEPVKEEPAAAAPAAASAGPGARAPVEGQKVFLNVLVIDGKDMPSVNTFGGCDPFVEVRIVDGDPTIKKGALNEVPIATAKTKTVSDSTEPKFNETVKLKGAKNAGVVHDSSTYVEFILWDWNATGNLALGYSTLSMVDTLSGLDFNASAMSQQARDHNCKFSSLMTGSNSSKAMKAEVKVSFSYLEVQKYTVKAVSGTKIPGINSFGSVSPCLEVRIMEGDPKRVPYSSSPGKECHWSDTTAPQPSNQEPKWRQELEGSTIADPSHHLLLAVHDAGTMGNTPIGFAAIPMKDVLTKPLGAFHEWKNLKLHAFPGEGAPGDIKQSKITVEIRHDLVMKGSKHD
mmetsp:Transcript_56219/g.103119  ORF Transcript_56219/g.103119 Transcript_56219/m.103119 type:complete len:606 (-) Transcript_56219:93-1910(-)